jgi:hypothetical protein
LSPRGEANFESIAIDPVGPFLEDVDATFGEFLVAVPQTLEAAKPPIARFDPKQL